MLKNETAQALRSLSQTCQLLRSLVLPFIWRTVHVKSVARLGILRETLRNSPDIARYIRNFTFMWDMGGDYITVDYWPVEAGTLLDLAFVDRWQAWDDLRSAWGLKILESGRRLYFLRAGFGSCFSPGAELFTFNMENRYDDAGHLRPSRRTKHVVYDMKDGRLVNDCHKLRGGRGPDGNGEDRFIKNADDFNDCLVNVVTSLSSLQILSWATPVVTMPRGVCDVLARRAPLTGLHVDLGRQSRHKDVRECICISTLQLERGFRVSKADPLGDSCSRSAVLEAGWQSEVSLLEDGTAMVTLRSR